MDTAYIIFIITGVVTVIGFLTKQALADRDRHIASLDADIDLTWKAISELAKDVLKSHSEIQVLKSQNVSQLKVVERLEKQIDDLVWENK